MGGPVVSRTIRSRTVFCFLVLLGCALGLVSTAAFPAEPASPESVAPALACPYCDDYNGCTVDSCDTTTGTCRHDPMNCDDGNPCTTDYCDRLMGTNACQHVPVKVGAVCDDQNSCTQRDACDSAGQCHGSALTTGTPCDDRNSCTADDACSDAGRCVGRPLDAGTICDDANACTEDDTCVTSADGTVACEGISRNCGDGDLCTQDVCNPSTGQCSNPPVNCDDGNTCTIDSCDPARGCVRSDATGPCNDGNACSTNDVCSGGNCGHPEERSCPPKQCMMGYCIVGAGCTYEPRPWVCPQSTQCAQWTCNLGGDGMCHQQLLDGSACSTGNRCEAGICAGGACQAGANLCDDHNPCTDDSCINYMTGACMHSDNTAPCGTGTLCTTQKTCSNGTCQGGVPITCDDGNACTADSCDPAVGCTHAVIPGLGGDCLQAAEGITVSRSSALGKGSGTITWTTTHEIDVSGFNVQEQNHDGTYTRLNPVPIPCSQCISGRGAAYSYFVPKHKSGRDLFIEMLGGNGDSIGMFGPASTP